VAKLVEYGRLRLDGALEEWMEQAVTYPGIDVLMLTPRIAIESTQLPGTFHRDPADQLIVATARVYDLPLLTVDRLILDYPHVRTL
jgi:PIN domain nuclease of toxin-antitoxin system